jgi:hypothetical protein
MITTSNLIDQLAQLGVLIGIGVIGYIVFWLRNKIVNSKFAKMLPKSTTLESELEKYFLPCLRNAYQEIVKPAKKSGSWNKEKAAEAFNYAYENTIKLLPDFIIKLAKLVNKDWESSLKAKLQVFYENRKADICIESIKTKGE